MTQWVPQYSQPTSCLICAPGRWKGIWALRGPTEGPPRLCGSLLLCLAILLSSHACGRDVLEKGLSLALLVEVATLF